MVKDRSVQMRNRHLATLMIRHGMRASIVAALFDMPLGQARQLYAEVMQKTSPSGQKPRSDEFYFAPLMRLHASAFLVFYRLFMRRGDGGRDRMRVALVAAYERYVKMCQGRPLLPIDRAWRLVALAAKGDGTVRETTCRLCRTYIIIQAHESSTRHTCPTCHGSLTVSRRLRGRSGRKKKGEAIATVEATGSA